MTVSILIKNGRSRRESDPQKKKDMCYFESQQLWDDRGQRVESSSEGYQVIEFENLNIKQRYQTGKQWANINMLTYRTLGAYLVGECQRRI